MPYRAIVLYFIQLNRSFWTRLIPIAHDYPASYDWIIIIIFLYLNFYCFFHQIEKDYILYLHTNTNKVNKDDKEDNIK